MRLLVVERPDLIPLLRRFIVDGDGFFEDVPKADLDYLVSLGLIECDQLGPS